MDRSKIIVRTSITAIIVNIFLVIFKAIVGFLANSIAIILDAVNNLSDAVSSIVTIIGAKMANKAPDKEHPYGHGRIEYIASVTIAIIILAAGITSLKESVEKIISPAETNYSVATIIVVTTAIFVKFFLGRFVKNRGKKVESQSLIASGTDAFFDAIISISTLVAAIISIVWNVGIEGYLGVAIAILIIKSGVGILRDSLNTVIGSRVDTKLSKEIKDYINTFEEVQGTYDLILHSYGPSKIMGALNIQVDENMKAKEIHGLTKRIIHAVDEKFGILLTIGIYASNESDKLSIEIKNYLVELLGNYDKILQLHGFYLDESQKNVSFDIIVDFDEKNPEKIKNEIIDNMKIKYPEYNYSVVIDNELCDI